jgi:hypothetical protein
LHIFVKENSTTIKPLSIAIFLIGIKIYCLI